MYLPKTQPVDDQVTPTRSEQKSRNCSFRSCWPMPESFFRRGESPPLGFVRLSRRGCLWHSATRYDLWYQIHFHHAFRLHLQVVWRWRSNQKTQQHPAECSTSSRRFGSVTWPNDNSAQEKNHHILSIPQSNHSEALISVLFDTWCRHFLAQWALQFRPELAVLLFSLTTMILKVEDAGSIHTDLV